MALYRDYTKKYYYVFEFSSYVDWTILNPRLCHLGVEFCMEFVNPILCLKILVWLVYHSRPVRTRLVNKLDLEVQRVNKINKTKTICEKEKFRKKRIIPVSYLVTNHIYREENV